MREHPLAEPQGLGVGRHDAERRLGDAGVAQVLVADLRGEVEDLLAPRLRIRLGQDDARAEVADQQLVEVGLVDDVRVERRRTGVERGRHPAHRQRLEPFGRNDIQRRLHDPLDTERLLSGTAARPASRACGAAARSAGPRAYRGLYLTRTPFVGRTLFVTIEQRSSKTSLRRRPSSRGTTGWSSSSSSSPTSWTSSTRPSRTSPARRSAPTSAAATRPCSGSSPHTPPPSPSDSSPADASATCSAAAGCSSSAWPASRWRHSPAGSRREPAGSSSRGCCRACSAR